jgi:hypothetical protein
MACIQLLLLQAPTDVPSTSGFVPSDLVGLADIVLPSWFVPLYYADGHLREVEITRHTDVLGYHVPKNARPVSLLL